MHVSVLGLLLLGMFKQKGYNRNIRDQGIVIFKIWVIFFFSIHGWNFS